MKPDPATEFSPEDAMAFTFGDPEPVLSGRDYLEMFEVISLGDYYEPPFPPGQISKMYRANQHHASALQVKRNIILSCFKPNRFLSYDDCEIFVMDYLMQGNGYLEQKLNMVGRLMKLQPSLAVKTRRMKEKNRYLMLTPTGENYKFEPGTVVHIKAPDPNQEIYGVPEYLAAMQSLLLNEAATLFRRKYYVNGSHAGFILYMTDALNSQKDVENLRTALKEAKGPGNFKNLLLYAPGGKSDGLQLKPIAEVAAKDEFLNIKNVTRDDVLAAHRVPPPLMSIVPNNVGGFGDVDKAARVFVRNEARPIMRKLAGINDLVGVTVFDFDDYEI